MLVQQQSRSKAMTFLVRANARLDCNCTARHFSSAIQHCEIYVTITTTLLPTGSRGFGVTLRFLALSASQFRGFAILSNVGGKYAALLTSRAAPMYGTKTTARMASAFLPRRYDLERIRRGPGCSVTLAETDCPFVPKRDESVRGPRLAPWGPRQR
jgi:hypothetical protein